MPPQQPDRLLDLIDDGLGFRAHHSNSKISILLHHVAPTDFLDNTPPPQSSGSEESAHIAMSFQDVHDLEHVTDIAKKDHVTAIRKRTEVRAEFGTRPPKGAR
jgi:hypothetical protein